MRRIGGLLLVAVVAIAGLVGSASAGAAEPRPVSEGGLSFPMIRAPEDPEEYAFSLELSEELVLRQIDERNVGVFYPGHELAYTLTAEEAHDAEGATVPTTLVVTGREIVTLTVRHREGNPAGGGAPFTYPILGGAGWEGGFRTITVPMSNPQPVVTATAPPATTAEPPAPAPQRAYVTRALGEDKLHYRPHSFLLSADGTFGVGRVQWQSYGGAVALASGRGFADDCTPNCAEGRLSHPRAQLRLSQLTPCQGKSAYAHLNYVLTGPVPEGFPRRGSFPMLPVGEDGKPDC